MTELLTPREVEVARLVAAGRSYKGIARELGISVRTVEAHVLSAAAKLPGEVSPKMRLVLFVVDLVQSEAEARRAS